MVYSCFGGGRRDEEKSRAKERIFSFRNAEQHGIRRTSVRRCGSFIIRRSIKAKASVFSRFPTGLRLISGSTLREKISQSFLFILQKSVRLVYRDGNIIMVDDDRMRLNPGEEPQMKKGAFPYSRMLSSDRWYRV